MQELTTCSKVIQYKLSPTLNIYTPDIFTRVILLRLEILLFQFNCFNIIAHASVRNLILKVTSLYMEYPLFDYDLKNNNKVVCTYKR